MESTTVTLLDRVSFRLENIIFLHSPNFWQCTFTCNGYEPAYLTRKKIAPKVMHSTYFH